jgi:predicted permease
MDSILLRSLPVADPASLAVVKWRSGPVNFGAPGGSGHVLHSIDGSTYRESGGISGAIFPYAAFERLQEVSASVFSGLFAYYPAGTLNVMIHGQSELAKGYYVSGEFFHGLAVSPAAGRPLVADDDRAGAAPVVVVSNGYSERRFGGAASAIGQSILINNVGFTIVGVAPPEFFGIDPGAAPTLYLPLHAGRLLNVGPEQFVDQNYYWLEMMGRLRPDVSLAQAQAALAGPFEQWVASTATTPRERANLPVLRLENGAGGLDTLRRQYSKPLYVLLVMVGLILAIACANTANLLLARAAARRREMAVRLSIGAGRFRVIRQLLTESVLLASLAGALGIVIAILGMGVLTRLLANGQEGFTLHAELNWHVLLVTLGLSFLCGLIFGLAPALQSASPALMPMLKDMRRSGPRSRALDRIPRVNLTQALVVAQIAISLLLLIATGLFVRTLSNLHSISLGFQRENILLFDVKPLQAGLPQTQAIAFYGDLHRRLGELPGVRHVTLSHASLVRAGRSHPLTVNGEPARGTRMLLAGPGFFTTMQIRLLRGREIEERDRAGAVPVAVVSDLFARTFFGDRDPIGRKIQIGQDRVEVEVVGVAASARYGPLRREVPPVVYVSYPQVTYSSVQSMTYALSTDGNPLAYAAAIRRIAHETDARVPVSEIRTQAADIDRTINQEIVFARLCTAFAVLALVIACVGLYGTMAYTVARRTREIGIRMALGAQRRLVTWMVLREVCLLAVVGLAIGFPIALASSRFIEAFLFAMKPNDPRVLTLAIAILLSAALIAGYAPARRASRIDPMVALREE